tara:strand:+ start:276 stop:731 length:456 start_codon:yes stop_codon:yes gene_type:complete
MLDIEDFKKKINEKSRLMGIDPGKRRVGISICDENRKIATPHKTLEKKDFNNFKDEIVQIIKDFNIDGIVIGNPIKMDGSTGSSSQSAKDLAINLSKNISLPIILWDERFSSEGSFKIMRNLPINSSKKRETLDKNAAAFILQGFIDFLNK